MRESSVEATLRKLIRKAGGESYKIAPTHAGIPDRLVLMPGGRIYLVELKAIGGKRRAVQVIWHERAAQLGTRVVLLTGTAEVRSWIKEIS